MNLVHILVFGKNYWFEDCEAMSSNILKNTTFSDALVLLNQQYREESYVEKIAFKKMNRGKFSYFLKIEDNFAALDITRDCFSPWSGKDRYGKRETSNVGSRYVNFDGSSYRLCDEVLEYKLKVVRNTHSSIDGFKRQVIQKLRIFYVEKEGFPVTDVLYIYSSENNFKTPLQRNPRVLASYSKKCRDALALRTSRNAKSFLAESGVKASMSQLSSLSRSVKDHIKTSSGRKAPTDLHKVMDRFVNKTNPEELISHPVIETKENGKVHVRLLIGFPKAFSCFGKGLPTVEDVSHHREEVRRISYFPTAEADRFFNSYLESCNVSGALPCLGSCVMVDTTFSLCSSEYVTVAIGVNDVFKSKNSQKSASILLAYMIHNSKELEEHEQFSRFLNDLFEKYCKNTTLNLLVHDGETSFKVYNSGSYLKDCISVRCDVHRLSNLKYALRNDFRVDYDLIKEELWGCKRRLPQGNVLKKGVLSCYSRVDYDWKFQVLVDECESEAAKRWLMINKDSLYDHNSMLTKLLGGWPAQYLSTNIIESKNSFLKTLITSKKPAQKVLDDFLMLHKEEMDERVKAVSGVSSKYVTEFHINHETWEKKTKTEKLEVLSTFGLQDSVHYDELSVFPTWSLPRKIKGGELAVKLKDYDVHTSSSDTKTFFVISKENYRECVRVCCVDKILKCFGYVCRNHSNSHFCLHSLVVALVLNSEMKEEVLQTMNSIRSKQTCTSLLREQMKPHHGTKTNRIGKNFSKGNYSRNFVAMVDLTSSSFGEDSMIGEQENIDIEL